MSPLDTASTPKSEQAEGAAAAGPAGTSQTNGDTGAANPNPAEEMVDALASKVGNLTSVWGRRALRLGSRIREEAWDIWAEAQSIRRGEQS